MNKAVYFTLGDIVALEDDTWYPNSSSDINISTIMTTYGLVIEDSTADKITVLTQLMRMVYSRFYDCDVLKIIVNYFDDEDDVAPTAYQLKNIWREFIGVFNLTAPRYIPLLTQFNAKSSDPIGKIESISNGTTRFNDTPQDGGDFADDEHTTNITATSASTSSDSGSIMERLDSLYRNWRSILKDWTNEFKGLFYVGGK